MSDHRTEHIATLRSEPVEGPAAARAPRNPAAQDRSARHCTAVPGRPDLATRWWKASRVFSLPAALSEISQCTHGLAVGEQVFQEWERVVVLQLLEGAGVGHEI